MIRQNVCIKRKLNEVNHDYDVLKRRAILRRADRLRKADKLKQKHEADIQRTLGIESYMSRQRDRDKQAIIDGALISIGMFIVIYGMLLWVVI